jgi:hypothetical protein
MNWLARKYFSPEEKEEASFAEVIFLAEAKALSWEEAFGKCPDLPRGWYELSRISPKDRIEFTRDFWLDRLPFQPAPYDAFSDFFELLDDVDVVLSSQEKGEPMSAQIIYSLEGESCFFHGRPPCSQEDILELRSETRIPLPNDFLVFAKIHNGFGKLSETGVFPVETIGDVKRRLADLCLRAERPLKMERTGDRVDPSSLVPFYEALGTSSFQCFYADWYPGNEMGNVYLSGIDYTISDTSRKSAWTERLAFATFLEWLAHYMQGMNVSR